MDHPGTQSDNVETRYAHILKPIKDLAQNWNIDISSALEDYLEELDHTTVSFDGGVTTMNFAQAALLVQSSSCIYSKKVEYLYSLVYQVLDLVTNKKKPAQKSSVDNEGNDEDANFNDDDDDEFLSLDDIPEGKNLYLKEDFEDWEKFQLLPQIPLCLIPLEEDEKGDNPLLSKKGEVLASRNDFKMNTCHVHSSGILLLDLSHLKLLEDALKRVGTQTTGKAQDVINTTKEIRNVHEVSTENDIPHDDFPPDEGANDVSFDQHEPMAQAEEQMEVDRDAMQGSEGQPKAVIEDRPPVKKKKVPVYLPLDINEELQPGKPFVKGRNIMSLCPGIEPPTRKRKRKNTRTNPTLEPINEYMYRKCFTYGDDKLPRSVNKSLLFTGCEDKYWAEHKRRLSINREQLQKEREINREEEEEEVKEEEGRLNPLPEDGGNEDNNYEDEHLVDDDLLNAIDIVMGNDGNQIQDQYNSFSDNLDDCELVNCYEDLVRKHVEEYLASAQVYAQVTDLSKRVSEWEDKIMPRLDEEDSHAPFDINIYGSNVIDSLYQDRNIKFTRIVSGKPQFEICRTFLATLMLANTGNVLIEEKGSLEKGMDLFELKLLSTKRHFEELQEYQAPSIESSSK